MSDICLPDGKLLNLNEVTKFEVSGRRIRIWKGNNKGTPAYNVIDEDLSIYKKLLLNDTHHQSK